MPRSLRIKGSRHQDVPPFLTLKHPTTLESFTCPTKKSSYKNCTHLDALSLELLHGIGMLYAGLLHRNKLKPVLVRLTQHNSFLCASAPYKLKYVPFDYCMYYDHIQYVWVDRSLGLHKSSGNFQQPLWNLSLAALKIWEWH